MSQSFLFWLHFIRQFTLNPYLDLIYKNFKNVSKVWRTDIVTDSQETMTQAFMNKNVSIIYEILHSIYYYLQS